MDSLVSTEWLAAQLGAPDLRVVDATYFTSLPGEAGRDAAEEYRAGHISGAVFLDLAHLHEVANPLPATMPSPERFASRVRRLGVGDGHRIVFYDNAPHHTAARAWWLFQAFGIKNTAILDGGLVKWRIEGRPVLSGIEALHHRHLTIDPDRDRWRTRAQMRLNLNRGLEQVLDARSPERFTGQEADPRPDTAPGHIPGSHNLRYTDMVKADHTYHDDATLRAAFHAAGIDLAKPVTMTCGSGITASILAFAAHRLGTKAAVYDGSWSEWGSDPSTPKALGPA